MGTGNLYNSFKLYYFFQNYALYSKNSFIKLCRNTGVVIDIIQRNAQLVTNYTAT
jgi:hypothetical protein